MQRDGGERKRRGVGEGGMGSIMLYRHEEVRIERSGRREVETGRDSRHLPPFCCVEFRKWV